jgi:hypothetical protein
MEPYVCNILSNNIHIHTNIHTYIHTHMNQNEELDSELACVREAADEHKRQGEGNDSEMKSRSVIRACLYHIHTCITF